MKRILKTIFVPNETDGILLTIILGMLTAVCLMAGQATFVDHILQYYEYNGIALLASWGLYLGVVLGCGTLIGDPQRRIGVKWTLAIGIATSLLTYYLLAHIYQFWNLLDANGLSYRRGEDRFVLLSYANWLTLLSITTLFLLSFLGTAFLIWLGKRIRPIISRSKINRTKVMITTAIVLGVVVIIRNILSATNEDLGFYIGDSVSNQPLADSGPSTLIATGIVGFFLLVLVPAWFFNTKRPGWIRGTVGLGYFFMMVVAVIFLSELLFGMNEVVVSVLGFAVTFCTSHVLVSGKKQIPISDGTSAANSEHGGRKRRFSWPSHWTVAPLILIIAAITVFVRYDVTVLLFDPISRNGLADPMSLNWAEARMSRQLSLAKNAKISFVKSGYGDSMILRCQENVAADILAPFKQLNSSRVFVHVENNQRQVDYSLLPTSTYVTIHSGEITLQQIEDIGKSGAELHLEELDIVKSNDAKSYKFSGGNLFFTTSANSPVENFLANLVAPNARITINVNHELSPEGITQIKKAASNGQVELNLFGVSQKDSNDPQWNSYLQLACDSNVTFLFESVQNDSQFLKLQMITGQRLRTYSNNESIPRQFRDSPLEFLQANTFLFYDSEKTPVSRSKLYFPTLDVTNFQVLADTKSDLHSLYLGSGTLGLSSWSSSEFFDPEDFTVELAKFSLLKELYLSSQHGVDSLDFLAKMPQLERLQIHVLVVPKTGTGFEACPSLKEVILLSAPSPRLIIQLKALPNLQRLVVLDVNYDYTSLTAGKKKLEKTLPGVSVEVYDANNFPDQAPQEFKDHVERLKKEILEQK